MKIYIVSIILNYDIKFPEGQDKRPENICLEDEIMPDTKQELLFRLRR